MLLSRLLISRNVNKFRINFNSYSTTQVESLTQGRFFILNHLIRNQFIFNSKIRCHKIHINWRRNKKSKNHIRKTIPRIKICLLMYHKIDGMIMAVTKNITTNVIFIILIFLIPKNFNFMERVYFESFLTFE